VCERPFVIVEKRGKVKMVFMGLKNLESLCKGMYGTTAGKLIKLKVENGYDLTYNTVSDGYLIRSKVFENRGIKLMTKFRPLGIPGERDILSLATFTQKQPAPLNNFEMGFTSETKAPDTFY